MKLIVGLGNPGKKYEKNRHNIGFMILEKIAQKKEIVFRLEPSFEARFAEMGDFKNRIKLVQPQTFINQSGGAVAKIKNYWKIDSEDIWVIYDDLDLEFGKIRISFDGTSAGHKGIDSIIDNIGQNFWRFRVGIGRSTKIPADVWVLKNFSKEEKSKLAKIIDKVAESVLNSLSSGIKEETIKE